MSSLTTAEWIARQKLAVARADAQAQRGTDRDGKAREAGQQKYSSKDLAGLKVAHELDEFEEGKEVILTLKDKGEDARKRFRLASLSDEEESEDELENLELRGRSEEKTRADERAKIKKPTYDVFGEEATLLGQYADDASDKANKGFRLAAAANAQKRSGSGRDLADAVRAKLRGVGDEGNGGLAGGSSVAANAGGMAAFVSAGADGTGLAPRVGSEFLTEEEAFPKARKKRRTGAGTGGQQAGDEAGEEAGVVLSVSAVGPAEQEGAGRPVRMVATSSGGVTADGNSAVGTGGEVGAGTAAEARAALKCAS